MISSRAILVPENAVKVFRGQIFDVYQWSQEMFDGSTKTFEMLKRPDTMQIIAVKDGKLIVVEDQQPGRPMQIHLPGGRADQDSTWLEAAKRELKEETGMLFATWRQLSAEQPAAKIEWFAPIFLAIDFISQGEQETDPDGEKIAVKLEDFSKVRAMALDGVEPMMSYLAPFFARVLSLEELLVYPVFRGQEIDRE